MQKNSWATLFQLVSVNGTFMKFRLPVATLKGFGPIFPHGRYKLDRSIVCSISRLRFFRNTRDSSPFPKIASATMTKRDERPRERWRKFGELEMDPDGARSNADLEDLGEEDGGKKEGRQ